MSSALIHNSIERLNHVEEDLVVVVPYAHFSPGNRRGKRVGGRAGEARYARYGEDLVEQARGKNNVAEGVGRGG